jgi:hypothetical protein
MHDEPPPELFCLNELKPEPLEWLWPARLPIGKTILLDGDPSQGKSLLTLDLAARLTRGREWPDGQRPARPRSIVLICCEDAVRDTILPRLAAAEADLNRVHIFGSKSIGQASGWPSFPEHCENLRRAIATTEAALVIADPFMSFLSRHISGVNDQMVRRALGPLAAVAESTRSALMLTRHPTKSSSSRRAMYRGSGSVAIAGTARMAYVAGQVPGRPDLRALACYKSNLDELPPALGYRVVKGPAGQPRVEWTGVIDVTADDLTPVCSRRHGEAVDRARDLLHEMLASGPCSQQSIWRKARELGIAYRTLERAKQEEEIISRQVCRDGRGSWDWCWPDEPGDAAAPEEPLPAPGELVYTGFREAVTPGEPPPGRWVGGVDFGIRKPFAAVWGVLDKDDVLWLAGEIYESGKPLKNLVARLPISIEWFADPTGAREIHELAIVGVRISASNNDRQAGIQAVQSRLTTGRLRILEGTCAHLLAEATQYRHDEPRRASRLRVETAGADHALDALRYLICKLDYGDLRPRRHRSPGS